MRSRARCGAALGAASALLLSACVAADPRSSAGGGDLWEDATRRATSSPGVILEVVEAGPREDVPSALIDPSGPGLPSPIVDPARIIPGGPPPDGIPAIDQPIFEPAADVDWLGEDEAVIALTLQGEHRAYPIQILIWHEIVNDTIAGRPVAVTYCPLCNSALAFDREVSDRLLTFGTSGRLYLSALVMYDRQTESLWSQVERTAVAGELTGTRLDLLPASTVRWADWRDAYPDGWVLSRDTGFRRDYGRNPYVGYDSDAWTLLDEAPDERFPAKQRVVTFPDARSPVAVLLVELEAAGGVAEVAVDGQPVVLLAARGLASALDSSAVAEGRSIAATGAFRPEVGGERLTFRAVGPGSADGVVATDAETGSSWDVLGRAVAGPLAGERLVRVPHLDTFWFAQVAFRPETRVLDLA